MAPVLAGEYNRVFILGGKEAVEKDWEDAFSKFGHITNIWVTKDKNTGTNKGVTYITYEKTSEACEAIEEMNGKYLSGQTRPLKVILASDKREGSRRNVDEDKMLMRLFIMISKDATENEIRTDFEEFGDIEYVRIIKDRKTGNSKGLAYVKYYKQSHGARAFEECDPKYKPIYADVRPSTYKDEEPAYDNYGSRPDMRGGRGSYMSDNYGGGYNQMSDRGRGGGYYNQPEPSPVSMAPIEMLKNYNHWGENRLEASVPDVLTQEQVYKLFDLVPGLDSFEMDRHSGRVLIEYSNPQCAAYAKDKIHGMEYPPGYRITVRVPMNIVGDNRMGMDRASGSRGGFNSSGPSALDVRGNLSTLVESIQKATHVLQTAGIDPAGLGVGGSEENVRWCNTTLPTKKPFASREAVVEERLFIVSAPDSFPDSYLEDACSRFGDLIGAYFLPGKQYGYAKFAKKESAHQAISMLHGQSVCGNRLKVMLADPPKYEREDNGEGNANSKRPRFS